VALRRSLQIFLAAIGAVAVLAGLSAVVLGSRVIEPARVPASVDSEFRFFAAWYVVAGMLLLRAVPRVEREGRTIQAVAAGFALAAAGRVISVVAVGAPADLYLVLMVIEFILPLVIVPWQVLVRRAGFT
jgi:hypothetical protein